MLSALFATAVIMLAACAVMAAEGELVWVKRAGGPDSVTATAISALPDGTALVAGRFRGPATFGPSEPNETTLIAGTVDPDLFVAKYTPYGTLEWAKRINGNGNFSPALRLGIAVMGSGSALVTGVFGLSHSSGGEEVTFDPGGANETTLTGVGGYDIFVAKYNSNGTLAWARRDGGTSDEYSMAVAAMRDGSAIVTGFFSPRTTFGAGEPNQTTLSADGSALFVAKYDTDGTLAWAKRGGGQSVPNPKTAVGRGIMALRDGSVVVTGSFGGDATFGEGEPNETTLTSSGSSDMFVAKYNPDGTLGWAKRAGGIQNDAGAGVGALADGGAVLTGDFYGAATFGEGEPNQTTLSVAVTGWFGSDFGDGTAIFGPGEGNQTTLTSAGYADLFVAKYMPDGRLTWATRAGNSSPDDSDSGSIAALSDGSMVVTGWIAEVSKREAASGKGKGLTAEPDFGDFVKKYTPGGVVVWTKYVSKINPIYCRWKVASFPDDSSVVTYRFGGTQTFGPGDPNEIILASQGHDDVVVAKLTPDGKLAWARSAGGPDYDYGRGVATLPDGSVLVTGDFADTATFGLGETNETTLSSADEYDIFVAKFEGPLDADYDGLPNSVETDTGTYNGPTDTGTDPLDPDTDGDGLIDGDEVHDLDPDTAGVQNPFDPLDPDTTGDNFQDTPDGVPDGENDYDGDGQSNAYELANGSNPLDAASIVPAVTYVGTVALVALLLLLVFSRLTYAKRRRIAS
jgi:hypothetical protein